MHKYKLEAPRHIAFHAWNNNGRNKQFPALTRPRRHKVLSMSFRPQHDISHHPVFETLNRLVQSWELAIFNVC